MTKFIFSAVVLFVLGITAVSCGNFSNPSDTPQPKKVKIKAKLQPAYYSSFEHKWAGLNDALVIKFIDEVYEPGDLVEIAGKKYMVITMERASIDKIGLDVDSTGQIVYSIVDNMDGTYDKMTAKEVKEQFNVIIEECEDMREHLCK